MAVFFVNGTEVSVEKNQRLLRYLRDDLHIHSAKDGCSEGACGCCTVIINGDAVASCITLTVECDGAEITTIEGLQNPVTNELDPIQQAFIDEYAFQCGYCTPGIIMASRALFNHNPHPTREEIAEALSGNYCRCISHYHVLDALEKLAKKGVE